jgi:hypothetical protein
MRSAEQLDSKSNFQSVPTAPSPQAAETERQIPEPHATDLLAFEAAALRLRQAEVAQRHRDLDDAISLLSNAGLCDELLIARLKKRKLRIKDEIARMERLLPG